MMLNVLDKNHMADIYIPKLYIPYSEHEKEGIISDLIEYDKLIKNDDVSFFYKSPRMHRSFKDMFGYRLVIRGYLLVKEY